MMNELNEFGTHCPCRMGLCTLYLLLNKCDVVLICQYCGVFEGDVNSVDRAGKTYYVFVEHLHTVFFAPVKVAHTRGFGLGFGRNVFAFVLIATC